MGLEISPVLYKLKCYYCLFITIILASFLIEQLSKFLKEDQNFAPVYPHYLIVIIPQAEVKRSV